MNDIMLGLCAPTLCSPGVPPVFALRSDNICGQEIFKGNAVQTISVSYYINFASINFIAWT